MTRPHVPQEVLDAAHARRAARHARDWAEADRLKIQIEAAGWRVVDRGGDFSLSPLHPADVEEGGRTRFGWSGAVPSRLTEADAGAATVVARARDAAALARARSLVAGAPAGTSLVIVVDAGDDDALAVLADVEQRSDSGVEAVWLAGPGGLAAAWNAGLRRSRGAVVVLAGDGVAGTGPHAVGPLLAALVDPDVAVAGARGLVGGAVQDLAPGGGPGPVAAVDDTLLAVRRADARLRGPLDERYSTPALLAAWWSLVLRDGAFGGLGEGEESPDGAGGLSAGAAGTSDEAGAMDHPAWPPANRSAVAAAGLAIRRDAAAPPPGATDGDEGSAEHRQKRDRYRLLDAFRDRPDLVGPATT